jgi:hypothetical protein
MRAMKSAQSKMHDPGSDTRGIKPRNLHAWREASEIGAVE